MFRFVWQLTLVSLVGFGVACIQHERIEDSQSPLRNHTSDECIQRGLRLMTPQLSEALVAFDEALALDPTSVVAHLNRGVVLARMGQLAEALESYDRALELDEMEAKDEWKKIVSTKAVTLANRGAVLLRLPDTSTSGQGVDTLPGVWGDCTSVHADLSRGQDKKRACIRKRQRLLLLF